MVSLRPGFVVRFTYEYSRKNIKACFRLCGDWFGLGSVLCWGCVCLLVG